VVLGLELDVFGELGKGGAERVRHHSARNGTVKASGHCVLVTPRFGDNTSKCPVAERQTIHPQARPARATSGTIVYELTYCAEMPEHEDKASDDNQGADSEEESGHKDHLFRALLRVGNEVQFSLQNSLTAAGVFVLPLALACLAGSNLGSPIPLAIAIALLVPLWFFLVKALKYARSRKSIYCAGVVLSAVLVLFGAWISSALEPKMGTTVPPTPQQTVIQQGQNNQINNNNQGTIVQGGNSQARDKKERK
jgi:hypothetical protein